MTLADPHISAHYLDANELADILGLSLRTITLRARRRPWLLPPHAELRDRKLLRWRQDVVTSWLELRLVTGYRVLRP
jgi:predicted DNA-binding transcriptional regulator AlpA